MRDAKWIWLGVAIGAAAICVAVAYDIWRRTDVPPPLPKAQAQPVVQLPAPEPPRPPTLAERLVAASSLRSAVSVLRPYFTDTREDPDLAAKTLAMWSASRLTWVELMGVAETKRGLVMKDPDAERGKRLCVSGSIVEIRVDRSDGDTLYFGGLVSPSLEVLRFIAVRSTGGLIEDSPARFCGVVTGLQSYLASNGSVLHAVFAVGMFDLPENRAIR